MIAAPLFVVGHRNLTMLAVHHLPSSIIVHPISQMHDADRLTLQHEEASLPGKELIQVGRWHQEVLQCMSSPRLWSILADVVTS